MSETLLHYLLPHLTCQWFYLKSRAHCGSSWMSMMLRTVGVLSLPYSTGSDKWGTSCCKLNYGEREREREREGLLTRCIEFPDWIHFIFAGGFWRATGGRGKAFRLWRRGPCKQCQCWLSVRTEEMQTDLKRHQFFLSHRWPCERI